MVSVIVLSPRNAVSQEAVVGFGDRSTVVQYCKTICVHTVLVVEKGNNLKYYALHRPNELVECFGTD